MGNGLGLRVGQTSPLRNLSANFSEEQIVILDGIRFSADMAGLALDYLWSVLQRIDQSFVQESHPSDIAEAALFAWSIVDAGHRFQQLMNGLPGLKQRTWMKDFRDRVRDIEVFRHAWQHQRTEAKRAVERRDQAFGAIGWAQHMDGKPTGRWYCAVAGSDLKGSSWTFTGPVAAPSRVGNRRIRILHLGGRELYLGRLVRDIFWAVQMLEEELSQGRVRLIGQPVGRKRTQDNVFEASIAMIVDVREPAFRSD